MKFLPTTETLPKTIRCAIIPAGIDPEAAVTAHHTFTGAKGPVLLMRVTEPTWPYDVTDAIASVTTLADCPPNTRVLVEIQPGDPLWWEMLVPEVETVHSSFGLSSTVAGWTWAQSQGHPMTHGDWGRPSPEGLTTTNPEKVTCPHCLKIKSPERS